MFDADFLANAIVWRWINHFISKCLAALAFALLLAVAEWQDGDPWVAVALVIVLFVLFLAARKIYRYGNRAYDYPEVVYTNTQNYNYDVRRENAPAPLTGLRAEPGARYRPSR